MKPPGYVNLVFGDFEELKDVPIEQRSFCFVLFCSLKRYLVILTYLLAPNNFSCIASTNLALCRQVELTQIDLFRHVDYVNSRKKLEMFFSLILYKTPQSYKIKIQNINIEQGNYFHSP